MRIQDQNHPQEQDPQDHLLQRLRRFSKDLTPEELRALEGDIQELKSLHPDVLFRNAMATLTRSRELLDARLRPVPPEASAWSRDCDKVEEYRDRGLREIADGRVAVLLLAGGQGTRLGVSFPKGMFRMELPSGRSLFELQAERILKLQALAEERFSKKGEITWYVMTSEATHKPTLEYFREKNFFGLEEKNVVAFKQGMLPCFGFDGEVLLDEKHRVSRAPDGNGGLYRALKVHGVLEDMRRRGIRSVHTHAVDNILVRVADPVFIGYCLEKEAECAAKVVEKSSPDEAVGVVCLVDGKYRVVEYSEISRETSELRQPDGDRLLYNAGNICNHYFTVDFLLRVCREHEEQLELHVARKKIPYVDENGTRRSPTAPNGIKIEKFVFDVFPFAGERFVVWQVERAEEFSPLKNSDGAASDCPRTARRDLLELHRAWLLRAGAKEVTGDVEVSPAVSYAGEGLESIARGRVFTGPFVVS